MFQGGQQLSIDVKGRMPIPARHRAALHAEADGRLVITKHPHGCLLMFTEPTWSIYREKILSWPMSARAWQRMFLGFATDTEIDSAGRILLSPELRGAAGLQKEVLMLGMGSHFEIWDAARYHATEAEALENGMPAEIAGFTF